MAAQANIRILVRGLEGFVDRVVRKLVLDIVGELVPATPIDTGWARSNWVPKIGKPFDGVAGSYPGPPVFGALNFGAQSGGAAAVAGGYTTRFGPVYITNNVPYIGDLDRGHSRQAPAGFVRAAIERAIKGLFTA